MPRWIVEMLDRPCICYPKAKQYAHAIAQAQSQDIKVTYIGPKENPNHNGEAADFIMHPSGAMDWSIDPTWHTNKGKP